MTQARALESWWIVDSNGCWIWQGQNRGGYGLYYYGKQHQAHRFVYQQYKKVIEAGKHLDHKCRNRICVNPDHMEEVSNKENVHRGARCKISMKEANEIRDLVSHSIFKQCEAAKFYGIGQTTISEIMRNKIWVK